MAGDEPDEKKADKVAEAPRASDDSVNLQAQDSFTALQDKGVEQSKVSDTADAARSGDLDRLQNSVSDAFRSINGNEEKFSKFGQSLGNSLKKDGIGVETKGSDISFTNEKTGESLTIKNGFQLDFNNGVDYYSGSSAANGRNPKDVAKGFAGVDNAAAKAGPKAEPPDGKGLRVGQDGSYSITETDDQGNQKTSKKNADGSRSETLSSETSTETTKYDKDGNRLQRRQDNIDGSYKEENYNPDGTVKKSIEGRADGSRTETEVNGRESTSREYGRDGKLASTTITDPERKFTEKPDGSFKSEQFNSDGTPKSTVEGRADQTSRVTEYSESSTKITERDREGNAIQKREERLDGSYKQENYNPDGSVKKSVEGRADGSRSETEFNGRESTSREYDRDGKLASTTITDPERKFTEKPDGSFKSEQFNPDGTPKSTVEGRADQTSRVTEYSESSTKITERDKDGNAIQKREERLDGSYKQENYNPDGSVKKSVEGRADGSRSETEFNGRESTSREYDRDGKLASTTITDPERKFTEKPDGSFKSEQFNPDGTPKSTVEGRADQTSRVTEYSESSTKITERDKDGNAIQKREERLDGSYKQENYNPDGTVKKSVEGRADGSRTETTASETGIEKSEFDQNGKLAQRRKDNLDGSYSQQNYKQDGSMRSSIDGNADGSRTETSYSPNLTETTKFDRSGNAIFNRSDKPDGSYQEQKLNPDGSTTLTEGSAEGRTETRISQAGTETTRYDRSGNVTYNGQQNPDGSGHEQRLNPDGSVTVRYTQANGNAKETTTHGNDVITRTETGTPDGRLNRTELPDGKVILEEKKNNGDSKLQVTDKTGEPVYRSEEKKDGSYSREFTDEYGTKHNIKGAADGSRVEKQVSELGEETTAYDSKGNVTFNQKVNPDGSGYQQILNADGSVTVNLRDSNGKIEQAKINPDTDKPGAEKTQDKEKAVAEAQRTLFNPEATAEDKLLAARDLAHAGKNTLKGEDGKTYRINTENYGKREGVVVTVAGVPALRGIVDKSTNEVSRQKNSRGQEVDYAGTIASEKFKNDPVLNYKRGAEPSREREAPKQGPHETPSPLERQKPLPVVPAEEKAPIAEYKAKATGYYPANTKMQGGTKDRIGNALKGHTLEDYLKKRAEGKAGPNDYVAIAMDDGKKHKGYPNSGTQAAPKYGDMVRIPELNAKYGGDIPFKVVDTGGRFFGKGYNKVDICRGDRSKAYDPAIQGTLTLQFYKKKAN